MSEIVPGSTDDAPGYGAIHGDILALPGHARRAATRSVNALLKRLSVELTQRCGRGFSKRKLEQMRLLHLVWPPEWIPQTPSAESAPRISQTASGESSVPAGAGR